MVTDNLDTVESYLNIISSQGTLDFNYVFNYTDHLGNIRLSYSTNPSTDPSTKALEILEENNYYPFGLKHANYNMSRKAYYKSGGDLVLEEPCPSCPIDFKYNYRYNSKEYQDELGLNMYDYGARNYDPALGRWMNIDPLAENSRSWTPYNYVSNNPINLIDPDGKDGVKVIDKKSRTITIRADYYVQSKSRIYRAKNGKIKTINGYSEKQIEKMGTKYNKYLNDLGINVSEGEYEGYKVIFDLHFKPGGNIAEIKSKADSKKIEGFSIGNSIEKGNSESYSNFTPRVIENEDGTESSQVIGGATFEDKYILMNISNDSMMNIIHEIFHTFGFDHPEGVGGKKGIMKYPPEKPNQDDINTIVNSNFLPKIEKPNEE